MDVHLLTDGGVEEHTAEELPDLLQRGDGLVWVDVPSCDEAASHVLSEVFGFHPMAVQDCTERNHVPKAHVYADHVFLVLHAPERGAVGHVHYLELDQFIGPRYLVTVHGPISPAVPLEHALRETHAVLRRLQSGRLRPATPAMLSQAIVATLIRHEEAFVATLAREVGLLEQAVMRGDIDKPEQFLEELFRARHQLLAVRTMAAQSKEIYGRVARSKIPITVEGHRQLKDLMDRYDRVRNVADGQREFLQGVIEFYQTRMNTKMTIAGERLAVIAAVTLPITAISSVYGVNIIVNTHTDFVHLTILLIVMAALSIAMLRWARQQGWW
jgi:magnesium transporter